jgi:hypothetical protein
MTHDHEHHEHGALQLDVVELEIPPCHDEGGEAKAALIAASSASIL